MAFQVNSGIVTDRTAQPLYQNPQSGSITDYSAARLSPTAARPVYTAPRPAAIAAPQVTAPSLPNIPKTNTVPQPAQTGPSQSYLNQVNQAFGQTDNLLNDIAGRLNVNDYLTAASGQFDAQRPLLDQAQADLTTQNQNQQDSAKGQAANAMADARNLYQETSQGVRQRYGGSNSAGEFANEIQGREFQRQQGNINDTLGQNLNQLQQQHTQIQTNYQAQLQGLESQKQSALGQARLQFEDALRQIDSARLQNSQAKSQAKLDALQQYNQNAMQLQNYAQQMQDQIHANTLQTVQQLQANILAYRAQNGQPVDLNSIPGAQYSTVGGQAGGAQSLGVQGYLNPTATQRRPDQNLFAG